MNIQSSNQEINFGAKVPYQTKIKLFNEAEKHGNDKTRIRRQIVSKIEQIEKWNNPKSEILITLDKSGHDCFYINYEVRPDTYRGHALKSIKGKSFLSKFLRLNSENISEAENKILNTYRRYTQYRP